MCRQIGMPKCVEMEEAMRLYEGRWWEEG